MAATDHDLLLDRFVRPVTFTVRLGRRDDLRNVEWFGAFTHHREILAEAYERQERGENVILLADLGGFPVGQAWVDLTKRRAESVGVLWAVRVLPWLQNLGIGSHLMLVAERLLRERDYHTAEVGVEKENAGARRLYERLGYRPVGELKEEYGYTTPDGVPMHHVVEQWILRKDLRSVG